LALAAVILAAGKSSRMGRPKLLLPWANTSILGHLIHQWHHAGASQITVVCSPNNPELEAELNRLNFLPESRIYNPAPDRGMFSSIQCAASWTGWNRELSHWAIVLGDQPHLKFETLQTLVEFGAAHPTEICLPACEGRGRHPVLMPKSAFLELPNSSTDNLKSFLETHNPALCPVNDPGLAFDLDRPEDYDRAISASAHQTSTGPFGTGM
jgi:molybdenum cofactor cytidylyltransferase